MDISNLFWMGIPITFLIQGVVAFLKKVGVKSEWLTVSSLLVGALFGFLARLELLGPPSEWTGWLGLVGFGLVCGLVASGSYAQVKKMYEDVRDAIDDAVMTYLDAKFDIIEEPIEEPEG